MQAGQLCWLLELGSKLEKPTKSRRTRALLMGSINVHDSMHVTLVRLCHCWHSFELGGRLDNCGGYLENITQCFTLSPLETLNGHCVWLGSRV